MPRYFFHLRDGEDRLLDPEGRLLSSIDAVSDATLKEARAIAAHFAARVPLVHNLVEGGVTPVTDSRTFFDLGYAATLHPLLLMHAMVAAAPRLFRVLRETGSTDDLRGEIADLTRMNELTGLSGLLKDADLYA